MALKYPLNEADFDDINAGKASSFILPHGVGRSPPAFGSYDNQYHQSLNRGPEAAEYPHYGYVDPAQGNWRAPATDYDDARSDQTTPRPNFIYPAHFQSPEHATVPIRQRQFVASTSSPGSDGSSPGSHHGHSPYMPDAYAAPSGAANCNEYYTPSPPSGSIHLAGSTHNSIMPQPYQAGMVPNPNWPLQATASPDGLLECQSFNYSILPQAKWQATSRYGPEYNHGGPPGGRIPFSYRNSPVEGVRISDVTSSLQWQEIVEEGTAEVAFCDNHRECMIDITILWPGYNNLGLTRTVASNYSRQGKKWTVIRGNLLKQIALAVRDLMVKIKSDNIPISRGFEKFAIANPGTFMRGIKEEDCLITALLHCGGHSWQPEILIREGAC